MVGRKLFLIGVLFLTACAEVVSLTGGEEDVTAPRVVKQVPEQGSLYVSTNELKLEFDEFFQLADPSNSILINPSLGKLDVEQINKHLSVSWKDTLKANTTYVIQLNGTIRDLNEGNDSIYQFAFSTGSLLDSLSIKGKISDAISNDAKAQVTIGLFPLTANPTTDRPFYATRSSAKGDFKFSYLPEASYQLFAFVDKNKNSLIDPQEEVAFRDSVMKSADTNLVSLRLFSPKVNKTRLKVVINNPGTVTVFNRDSLNVDDLTINGDKAQLLDRFSKDSVVVGLPKNASNNWQFIYQNDTVFKTRDSKLNTEKLKPQILNKKYVFGDSLEIQVNDLLQSIDSSLIHLKTELEDSIRFKYLLKGNSLVVVPLVKKGKNLSVFLGNAALKGAYSTSDSLRQQVTCYGNEDLSILKVNTENFNGQWILQLVQGKEILQSCVKSKDQQFVRFSNIVPGNYSVKCIQDTNENGEWDTGNLLNRIQPEIIVSFTLKEKLRANWEVEETLQYKP